MQQYVFWQLSFKVHVSLLPHVRAQYPPQVPLYCPYPVMGGRERWIIRENIRHCRRLEPQKLPPCWLQGGTEAEGTFGFRPT